MSSTSRIIFITGANTGLGLETVKSLLRSSNSYTILLGSRSLQKAAAAADEAKKEFPDSKNTIETVQIDIESDDSIQQAFKSISGKYGKIDTLVNNAGEYSMF
jgi:NAD(P)-dependent dehydrogenase (short-subunit alcohol dehydrogenase family)